MRRRPKLLLVPLAVGLGLVAARVAAEQPLSEVACSADAWISRAPSHQNHGQETTLRVGGAGSGRALLRFDQAAIQAAVAGRVVVAACPPCRNVGRPERVIT